MVKRKHSPRHRSRPRRDLTPSSGSSPYEILCHYAAPRLERQVAFRDAPQVFTLSADPTLVLPTVDALDVPRVEEHMPPSVLRQGCLLDSTDCDTDRERQRARLREEHHQASLRRLEEQAIKDEKANFAIRYIMGDRPELPPPEVIAAHPDAPEIAAFQAASGNPQTTLFQLYEAAEDIRNLANEYYRREADHKEPTGMVPAAELLAAAEYAGDEDPVDVVRDGRPGMFVLP